MTSSLSMLTLVMSSLATAASAGTLMPEGVYQTACTPIGKDGRHGFIAKVTITADAITAMATNYAHNDCDNPTVQVTYEARIEDASVNGDHIDFIHRAGPFAYTLLADDITAYYNTNSETAGCGIDDWKTGETRNVAGRICAPFAFPAEGTVLKDAVWTDQGTIAFGNLPMNWSANADFPQAPSPVLFTARPH